MQSRSTQDTRPGFPQQKLSKKARVVDISIIGTIVGAEGRPTVRIGLKVVVSPTRCPSVVAYYPITGESSFKVIREYRSCRGEHPAIFEVLEG
jgi:hypothetical protein